MSSNQVNLLDIFKGVSSTMRENQQSLNQADEYNHDHGDHMVEIFDVITQAMKEKKDSEPAEQLEYAAQLLKSSSKSGSSQVYAKNLTQASKEFKGKQVDKKSILPLIMMLLGGGYALSKAKKKADAGTSTTSTAGGLLETLMGGGSTSTQSQPSGGGLLETLLGGGAAQSGQAGGAGLDLTDLIGAGMQMLDSSKGSGSDLGNLAKALVGNTQMAEKPYRQQSGTLLTNTVLQMLSGLGK